MYFTAKKNPSPVKFYNTTGEMHTAMKILEKQTLPRTGEQLTFFPEGSPASPTAPQESVEAKMIHAIYGPKCVAAFEKLPRPGLWAKTFAALLIGRGDWYSRRCRLIWKLKGTKYNRSYFQLRVLTRRTKDTGYGLLPTPICMDTNDGDLNKIDRRRERAKAKKVNGNGFGMTLMEMAQRRLLPTPTCSDSHGPCKHGTGGLDLATLIDIHNKMLPTPTASDGFKGTKGQNQNSCLHNTFQTGGDSQLNHRFVLEMMGFPPDWTELPFLLSEEIRSKQPATP